MAFVIQGAGARALGPGGGGLGYGADTVGVGGGLPRSLAIKFDIYSNSGEGINSTGIFTGGRSPTIRQPGLSGGFPDKSITLDGSGIDLHSGHPFAVSLGYDGATLTETITDTVTSATFTTSYAVNIPGLVGSDVGYVGFTGGTGGLSAVQDILSWTFQTTIDKHNVQPTVSGSSFAGSATLALSAPAASDPVAASTPQAMLLVQSAGATVDDGAILLPAVEDDWIDAMVDSGEEESDSTVDAYFEDLGDGDGDLLDVLASDAGS